MIKREIIEKLVSWKNSKKRKPLILTGVRQCGKTSSILEFGNLFFKDVAYINFEETPEAGDIFDYNFDTDRILDALGSLILNKKITVGSTLLVFDEIQVCPKAITSLKYFCEKKRDLHLIAAGSLLGVALRSNEVSFPVGKVDRLRMFPLSFREFVVADGGEKYITGLEKYHKSAELPGLFTTPLEDYLKKYYIVGGMPEVVQDWIDNHDFDSVEKIQNNIIRDYSDDLVKHAPKDELQNLRAILDCMPEQLAKENNKFIFSRVKQGARAKELETSVQWLIDAGLVHKLDKVEKPEIPLSSTADAEYFKLYFSDIGLMRCKAGIYYKTILEESDLYQKFKGAMAENYVLCELIKQELPAWFWRSGNTAELDLISEYHGEIIPIEVKAADNTMAKSYRQFAKKYSPPVGFKFSLKNIGKNMVENTETYSLPLYLVYRICEYM